MEITILKESSEEFSFILKDISHTVANTLRRLMVAETPTLSIDEVTFIKNDSALYDEILAHRLGLIPLKTDLSTYEQKEVCSCKGQRCSKCSLKLTLKTKGPKTVYSSDLISEDSKIKSVYDNIPIVILLKNQELELEATAALDIGKKHNKNSPGLIFYKSLPKIKILNESGKVKELLTKYPNLTISDSDILVKDIQDFNTDVLENICGNLIEIKYSKKDFIFNIESFGQLKPKEILKTALKVYDSKLTEFEKALKEAKPTKIESLKNKIKKKS